MKKADSSAMKLQISKELLAVELEVYSKIPPKEDEPNYNVAMKNYITILKALAFAAANGTEIQVSLCSQLSIESNSRKFGS